MISFHKTCYFIALNSIKLSLSSIYKKNSALILHHGMLGSARNLRPLCKNSNLLNFVDVILIDARNHGQSEHTLTHSISDLASDLKQFIDKQKQKYEGITVLGHSMGGLAVMQMTKKYTQLQKIVQRVIIVDIPCNPVQSKGSWSQQGQLKMLEQVNKIDLKQSTSQIFRRIQQVSLDSDYANLIKFNLKIPSSSDKNNIHKWKVNLPLIINHYKQMTTYTLNNCKWKGPVQVIYGSQSGYFEQDQIQHFMKQYSQMKLQQNFHRIDGAGHWVHFDRKKQFLQTVQKILKRNKNFDINSTIQP